MNSDQAAIFLITGIMASGKSTVAQHLAGSLPKSVHLRGDVFRRMIVNGRKEMEADFDQDAFDQLLLRYRIAAQTAHAYAQAGFTVVYQDVILGPVLTDVVGMLRKTDPPLPIYVVVLCPSPEVVAQREAERGKIGYRTWTPADLDNALRAETPHFGLWLDTSALSVEATVTAILDQLEAARV